MKKKPSKLKPKPEAKKVYRVKWELASTFLLKGWKLLDVKTKGKEMIAEMHAPDKSKS